MRHREHNNWTHRTGSLDFTGPFRHSSEWCLPVPLESRIYHVFPFIPTYNKDLTRIRPRLSFRHCCRKSEDASDGTALYFSFHCSALRTSPGRKYGYNRYREKSVVRTNNESLDSWGGNKIADSESDFIPFVSTIVLERRTTVEFFPTLYVS